MNRRATLLTNACTGFALGNIVASHLRGRRAGVVLGPALAAVSSALSLRVYDRVAADDAYAIEIDAARSSAAPADAE